MADVGEIMDERQNRPTNLARRHIVDGMEDVETRLVATKAMRLHSTHTYADRRNRPERVIKFSACLSRGTLRARQSVFGIRGRNPVEKRAVEELQRPAVEGKQRLIARQQRQHRLGEPMGEMSDSGER